MLRHIGVNVQDLVRVKSYYDEFMPFLGYELHISAADQFAYRPISDEHGSPTFFYSSFEEATYSRHQPGLQHLVFMVEFRDEVHKIHAKTEALGSEIIHLPRWFPEYRPYYYATF